MTLLRTIGYEGASLDDFVATLLSAKVQRLLDVRAIPISRRRGFSKSALRATLADNGIEYVHIKPLGDPKPGREASRAGRYADFKRIYLTHLSTFEATQALGMAVKHAQTSRACLMCYEQSPEWCHRRLVADALSQRLGFKIQHLSVDEGASAHGTIGQPRKRLSPSQSGTATQPTVR
jgi:uncharacterized protein (DUF488 family)